MAGKSYCDLGCGTYHPYGISTIFYLNGAVSTVGLDVEDADEIRAAEALYDLLIDCIAYPEKWCWEANMNRAEFVERARSFNLNALQNGQLRAGIGDLPLKHVVTDIHDPVIAKESIDIMSSRAVLEHFLDFGVAVDRLFALMRPGGVAYHHIDLADHRAYWRNSSYHRWSFLAENDDWSDNLTNRLRASEIRPYFEKTGFNVLKYEIIRKTMPKGFEQYLKGRFRSMSKDDLEALTVFCILVKP
ncbi:MAG: methyltransferase domain-containing protein [Bacteroidia bacterium]|nr:methyltransferase domain-containing protein [Bacteroidia bacterium]